MHGRNAFRLTEAERQQLKQIQRGGMLLADSVASRAFSESFRSEMAAIFPQTKLERIPADDPLLGVKFGGFDLKAVSRRDPQSGAQRLTGGAEKGPARPGGHQIRRPLGRDLLAVRSELALESATRWNVGATSAKTPPGSGLI